MDECIEAMWILFTYKEEWHNVISEHTDRTLPVHIKWNNSDL